MNKLTIQSFPRIHITLIGMNDDDYRMHGGIGFSLSNPTTSVSCVQSNDIKIIDKRENKISEKEEERLCNIIKSIINENNFDDGITCSIEGAVFPHYGFGSGTSVYLSCIEALFLLNKASYDIDKIIRLSKRGGASGIGINTYYNGGFVFDVGVKNEGGAIEPSSLIERNDKKPLIIHKGELPDWKVGICIPKFIKNKSQQEEIDFFKQICPIDKSSVVDTINLTLSGSSCGNQNVLSPAFIVVS